MSFAQSRLWSIAPLVNRAQAILTTITIPAEQWHVGDAAGLDALVREYNSVATVHRIQGNQSWHFAERSQRMVDAVGAGGVLCAFPNGTFQYYSSKIAYNSVKSGN